MSTSLFQPFALACAAQAHLRNGKYGSESVWNEMAAQEGAGGGGVSDVFPKPPIKLTPTSPLP